MRRNTTVVLGLMLLLLLASVSLQAENDKRNSRGSAVAHLRPIEEVPALSTPGSGELVATINGAGTEINYALRYSNLAGTAAQAHFHIGQKSVNGGIMIFLCSNLGNGPAGTQPCPTSGTITGTIHAANVIGPTGQGIGPGELAEVIQAIRNGVVYANVHTDLFPGGEIRGQVNFSRGGAGGE
jgi:CHRD domain